MGTCIICGTDTDGEVCDTHEEDVAFSFEGTSPNELTPGRYYRGTVDGYADFGVFVDVGDSVTGLLHESELDQRLDSLTWAPGDEVFVQVDDVRDNGNVDLSWSIRQSADEFRGVLVDAPGGDRVPEDEEPSDGGPSGDQPGSDDRPSSDDQSRSDDQSTGGSDASTDGSGTSGGVTAPDEGVEEPSDGAADAADVGAGGEVRQRQSDGGTTAGAVGDEPTTGAIGQDGDAAAPEADTDTGSDPAAAEGRTAEDASPAAESTTGSGTTGAPDRSSTADESPEPVDVGELDDHVGDLVRVEGEVVGAHQTSGPTIFELRDGSGVVECAAFEAAGVRAYPEVDVGDHVRLDGEVERRRGELQIETETLLVLTGEERDAVAAEVDAAIEATVRPDEATFVAADDPAEPLAEGLREAATRVRKAIAEDRPVVVRHAASADGYAAGAALERGAIARARSEADGREPDYHAVDRRPLDDRVYGMDAVTSDLTRMLEDRERHDEQLPLLVLLGLGSSSEAIDAARLLDVYGVDRVVLDAARPDEGVEAVGEPVVNPHLADVDVDLSAAALGSALGATVEPAVAGDLAHLPAVGYWESAPETYVRAAEDAGVDADERRAIREALALEAHYQSYNDKRELVDDICFGGATDLAEHVAEQFREKRDTELATARENLTVREARAIRFGVLDTDAFTHRFDFPPTDLLLDELHRDAREDADGVVVTVGAGEEELSVRSTEPVDVRAIAERASEDVPGVEAVGGRDGHLEYLPGVREAAIEAVIAALAESIQD